MLIAMNWLQCGTKPNKMCNRVPHSRRGTCFMVVHAKTVLHKTRNDHQTIELNDD